MPGGFHSSCATPFTPPFERSSKMRQQELISKLIHLEEQAKAHTSEYLRLMQVPGSMGKASFHNRKAVRLRSRIKGLMRQIALFRGNLHSGAFDKDTNLNSPQD